MRFFKLVSIVVLTLSISSVALASTEKDTSNKDENGKTVRGPYASQGAGSNWFVGVGGGFNMFTNLKNNFTPDFTPALDVNFGKWFDPNFGARIAYQGLTGAMNPPDGSAADDSDREHFGFAYFHGDILWNLSNTIGGYRSDRLWEFVPYAHFGLFRLYDHEGINDGAHRVNTADNEFGGGVGLMNKIYLHKRVDLIWDTRMFVVSGRFHNWEVGGLCYNVCSTLGLAINLGKTGFQRVTDETGPLSSALADAEAALAAARAKNDSLANALANAGNQVAGRDTINRTDTLVIDHPSTEMPLTIFFEKNSADLDEASEKQIAFYIETIFKQDPSIVLYFTGSADKATGTEEYNKNLGTERVKTTINYIHEKFDIPLDQLKEKTVIISDHFSDNRLDRSVKIEH